MQQASEMASSANAAAFLALSCTLPESNTFWT
jgi:hypothetical protein